MIYNINFQTKKFPPNANWVILNLGKETKVRPLLANFLFFNYSLMTLGENMQPAYITGGLTGETTAD